MCLEKYNIHSFLTYTWGALGWSKSPWPPPQPVPHILHIMSEALLVEIFQENPYFVFYNRGQKHTYHGILFVGLKEPA